MTDITKPINIADLWPLDDDRRVVYRNIPLSEQQARTLRSHALQNARWWVRQCEEELRNAEADLAALRSAPLEREVWTSVELRPDDPEYDTTPTAAELGWQHITQKSPWIDLIAPLDTERFFCIFGLMQTLEPKAGTSHGVQNDLKKILNQIRVECQESNKWEQIRPLFTQFDAQFSNFLEAVNAG